MTKEHYKEFCRQITTRPDDFKVNNYTLDDTKVGTEYWIANGMMFFGVHKPFEQTFQFPYNIFGYLKVRGFILKEKRSKELENMKIIRGEL